MHMPGHSPGSLSLHDADNGVLVTADTLYQTSAELIDWFPGSSVKSMAASVEKLAGLAESGTVDVALPGHNDILTRETLLKAASRHLEMASGNQRALMKFWSRLRARAIFATYTMFPLPDYVRHWSMK